MIPVWRNVHKVTPYLTVRFLTAAQSAASLPHPPVNTLMEPGYEVLSGGSGRMEGVQGPLPPDCGYSASVGKEVLKSYTDSLKYGGPAVQGVQPQYDIEDRISISESESENNEDRLVTSPSSVSRVNSSTLTPSQSHALYEGVNSHVSLYGCMQSNVPHPTSDSAVLYGSLNSMPGAGGKLFDKFLSASRHATHPSRHFSTSVSSLSSIQGSQDFLETKDMDEADPSEDRCPQGIQGDDCVRFKLWMENCYRYHLPNCDEQAEAVKSGKKTLSQVFREQEEIIREVAVAYKLAALKEEESESEVDAQGLQDSEYGFRYNAFESCPQGIQGEDCDTFKLWAFNCDKYQFSNCQEDLHNIRTGRRSLRDVFEEQEQMIKKVVSDYQQRRQYSTDPTKLTDETNSSTDKSEWS